MTSPKIVLRLAGGLGNQLFQFAAASNLVTAFGAKNYSLHIDTRFLASYESKHDYQIEFLAKHYPGILVGHPNNWFSCVASQFRVAKVLDRRVGPLALISSVAHLKKACAHANYAKQYVLDGYFQHPDILFGEQQRCLLRDSLLSEKSGLINSVKNGRRCTGVHIRRGDYVSSKAASQVFRTIPIEYYHAALNRLPDNNQIIVFSDDRKLSAEFASRVGGVDARQLNLSLEDEFCLLMACDDHIIANSTFSWWAAYLGHRAGVRVISPASWYINQSRSATNPLLLPYFELIEA